MILTDYLMFVTMVGVEEVSPFILNCTLYKMKDRDFCLTLQLLHRKATTECLYPVKFDLDLIPSIYAVGFYAHFIRLPLCDYSPIRIAIMHLILITGINP